MFSAIWAARSRGPALGIGGKAVERGERKRGGLAGSGLSDAQQVAAGQQRGDCLGLDRGGIGIALGLKRTDEGLGQAKVSKVGHENTHKMKRRTRTELHANEARCRSMRPCVKTPASRCPKLRQGKARAPIVGRAIR
jgi:hypothetical protein